MIFNIHCHCLEMHLLFRYKVVSFTLQTMQKRLMPMELLITYIFNLLMLPLARRHWTLCHMWPKTQPWGVHAMCWSVEEDWRRTLSPRWDRPLSCVSNSTYRSSQRLCRSLTGETDVARSVMVSGICDTG